MIQVKEITSKKEIKKFINFPIELYKGNQYYVPEMYSDVLNLFNKKKNSAYEYCESKFFLAYDGKKIVGRIGAILNKAYNQKMDVKQLRFTRFDVIDDIEVTKALFNKVFEWGRKLGMTELVGPNGFCDFDKEGMLIEGYDEMSNILTYYNYPYYKEHLESLGFVKEVDWVEYQVFIPEIDDPYIVKLDQLSQRIIDRYNFKVEQLPNLKSSTVYPVLHEAFGVINEAFANLYGTVPLNEGQVKFYENQFVPIASTDFAIFIRNSEGKMIGMGFMASSLSDVLKKSNGKLFPTGFIGVLKALKKHTVMDMYMVAVLPEYQNKGVNVIIVNEAMKSCAKNHVEYCETGPELENNIAVQSMWKNFEKRQHRRRRLFKVDIK